MIYHGGDDSPVYRAGVALVDLDGSSKILVKSAMPIVEPGQPDEMSGLVRRGMFPEAAMILDGIVQIFCDAADSVTCVATAALDEVLNSLESAAY